MYLNNMHAVVETQKTIRCRLKYRQACRKPNNIRISNHPLTRNKNHEFQS